MRHTRELHIVSGELNILKRTLYPLGNVIKALRDHSSIKHTGCFNTAGVGGSAHNTALPQFTLSEYDEKTKGAEISATARVYLADVADHVLILTEEVDMLKGTVENMINMVRSRRMKLKFQIFNLVAAAQNETMRQLTMASLIFLPLTFLTGYFGMNFNQQYWRVMVNNGPLYYWQIAIPTTIFVMCLLMYSYIRRLMKTLGHQVTRKRVKIKLRKNREMRRHRGTGGIPRVNTANNGVT
jgi:Mg2+ and Co2+ transporter CorA